MEKGMVQPKLNLTIGDAAVSGMFGGLLGGLAMAAVIAVGSLAAGQGFAYLGNFAPGDSPISPMQGSFMHLAVSSIYGLLYGVLHHLMGMVGGQRLVRVPGWLTGLVYAITLWVFAVQVLLPSAQSLLLLIPRLVFFAGHVAYGLVLGHRQK